MQRNSRGKQPFLRFLFSPLFLILGLIVFFLISFSLGKEFLYRYEINKEVDVLKNEIAELEKNNQGLSKLLAYLNTEAFLEKEARSKFNLAKPGENVLVLPSEKIKEKIKENKGDEEKKISNPKKWRLYFFGRKS